MQTGVVIGGEKVKRNFIVASFIICSRKEAMTELRRLLKWLCCEYCKRTCRIID